MKIEKNKVVSFHYTLMENDQVLEDSHDGHAIAYLHGFNNMIEGVEEAMAGREQGENFSVTLPPEKAYGLRNENAIQRVSINHVMKPSKKKMKYKPGMIIQLNSNEGPREVVVVKAGLKTLDVDTDHPLAGKTLSFNIEITDVREATAEEIAHGHAHGDGGHHH